MTVSKVSLYDPTMLASNLGATEDFDSSLACKNISPSRIQ